MKAKFRVGDRVRNTFVRGDGTLHDSLGTIKKICSYGADIEEDHGGPIRACFHELKLIRRGRVVRDGLASKEGRDA